MGRLHIAESLFDSICQWLLVELVVIYLVLRWIVLLTRRLAALQKRRELRAAGIE